MWKLIFRYRDGSVCTVTNKAKEITPEQLEKYTKDYRAATSAEYQEYPKKENALMKLW